MPLLCTLADRDPARGQAVNSLGRSTDIVQINDGNFLVPTLRRTVVSGVVTGMEDGVGNSVVPAVTHARREFPWLPILCVYDGSPTSVESLVPLVRAGVDEFVQARSGIHESRLRQALGRALQRRGEDEALTRLLPALPPRLRPFVGYCFTQGHHTLTVESATTALSVARSTIALGLAESGLPSSGKIVALARAYAAACLFDAASWSIDQVGTVLGFGGGSALSHFIYRHLKVWPTDLPAGSSARYVLDYAATALTPSKSRRESSAAQPAK